jgi:hypothetical protein|tara:strand:+ start:1049 stop:1228 length:180 start_codon:yes stop_codon:yes gene_type:complete
MQITEAQKAELKFLRREVDKWQDELYRLDAHPNVQTNLWVARKELKKFTSQLRIKGINI